MRAQVLMGLTGATTSGALTTTGAETVFDTTNVIHYGIRGVAYTKAATADGVTPTTDLLTAAAFVPITAGYGATFGWFLDSSGNFKVTQSALAEVDASGNYIVAPEVVDPGDDYALVATTTVKAASTASSWTFGASNWNATGITATSVSRIGWPPRPPL